MREERFFDYGLERLQRISNALSGKPVDVRSDLNHAFKLTGWLNPDEVPESLEQLFNKIDEKVRMLPKDERNNAYINSINSLNQEECEQLVSDIKSLTMEFEIYMLKQKK